MDYFVIRLKKKSVCEIDLNYIGFTLWPLWIRNMHKRTYIIYSCLFVMRGVDYPLPHMLSISDTGTHYPHINGALKTDISKLSFIQILVWYQNGAGPMCIQDPYLLITA